MAREVNKLTALTVSRAKEPGRYGDGAGLYLQIDPNGSRRWMMIFRQGGRQREMGLGSATIHTLADARRKRDDVHRLIADGKDPIAERKRPDLSITEAVTFGAFADALVPELVKGYSNAKHRAQWTSTLKTYAAPLRSKPITDITTDDVLAVLTPIWTTKSETASRVRGRIEKVLDAAKAKGLRTGENPARLRGHLDNLLPKRKKLTRGHHTALPFADVPAFIVALRERTGISAVALQFTILTAARVSEVLECPWSEIDLKAKLWTVPAARMMKSGREHRVPLSPPALEILTEMAKVRRGDLVFPSFRADKPMSDMAISALYKRMGVKATTHGFRSSFRDWAGETTNFPREVAELALSHTIGDEVERAYRRGDALEKRRALMDAWATFVTSETQG